MVSAPALLAADSDESTLKDSNEKSGWDIDSWTIQTSLYTYHFDPDPDHVDLGELAAALEAGIFCFNVEGEPELAQLFARQTRAVGPAVERES